MGACEIGGKFEAYDWKEGIRRIQEEAAYEYGHDYYNGAANNVSFRYGGDKSNLTKKQLDEYVKGCMEKLGTGDGEVIKIGSGGFRLYSTEYKEGTGIPMPLSFDSGTKEFLKRSIRPAVLLTCDNNGRVECHGEGTIAKLKEMAHNKLRSEFYRRDYYILRKNATYICCMPVWKDQSKTTRKTTPKLLVVEKATYGYYGWAPL